MIISCFVFRYYMLWTRPLKYPKEVRMPMFRRNYLLQFTSRARLRWQLSPLLHGLQPNASQLRLHLDLAACFDLSTVFLRFMELVFDILLQLTEAVYVSKLNESCYQVASALNMAPNCLTVGLLFKNCSFRGLALEIPHLPYHHRFLADWRVQVIGRLGSW